MVGDSCLLTGWGLSRSSITTEFLHRDLVELAPWIGFNALTKLPPAAVFYFNSIWIWLEWFSKLISVPILLYRKYKILDYYHLPQCCNTLLPDAWLYFRGSMTILIKKIIRTKYCQSSSHWYINIVFTYTYGKIQIIKMKISVRSGVYNYKYIICITTKN